MRIYRCHTRCRTWATGIEVSTRNSSTSHGRWDPNSAKSQWWPIFQNCTVSKAIGTTIPNFSILWVGFIPTKIWVVCSCFTSISWIKFRHDWNASPRHLVNLQNTVVSGSSPLLINFVVVFILLNGCSKMQPTCYLPFLELTSGFQPVD